ncbi:MAG: hypothetical protein IH618_09570 [Ignavibacteriaceae bacterium]|nr:hypothetical protein [Ignavibacteriaceae bacterium]
MSWKEKLKHELKSVGIATLYFLIWFGFLMLIKVLLLEDYDIEFTGVSMVIVGALVVAKVILIMEYIPLGSWVKKQPAYVDVILRTVLYSLGVLVILILEKGFEGSGEYGGFLSSVRQAFNHVDIYHVWVNTIVVFGALLVFNTISIFRKQLGKGGLMRMLLVPPPEEIQKNN